jgi:16S rRNA processing protein RimM
VENLEGQALGTVHDLMDNGAHPILRVQPADENMQEMLIPFVDQFVIKVDRDTKKITADWGLDY